MLYYTVLVSITDVLHKQEINTQYNDKWPKTNTVQLTKTFHANDSHRLHIHSIASGKTKNYQGNFKVSTNVKCS